MSLLLILTLSLLALALTPRRAWGCFSIVLGKEVSPTGHVLVGHNEDDPGRLTVRHGLVPERSWALDAKISAEDGAAQVDQVAFTQRFFWTQVRGSRGLSGSDCFYNDSGVVIFSNNCRDSRHDAEPDLIGGGVEYLLRRTLAEQAASASDGVNRAIALLDRWGYRASGRTYIIADAQEAWMIQVARGRSWCALRIGDDEAAVIPNHYTVRAGDLQDRPHRLSPKLVEDAIARGWYRPETQDRSDFDFAKALQDPSSWRSGANTYRHRHSLARILGRPVGYDEELPLAVKPGRVVTLAQVKAILRDHYEGTDDDCRVDFAGHSPHYTARRRICTGGTVESLIALLHPDPRASRLWLASGRPCSHPYQPLWPGLSELPQELEPMEDPAWELDHHFDVRQDLLDCRPGGWQSVAAENVLIDLVYSQVHPLLEQWIAEREAQLEEQEQQISQQVQWLQHQGDAAGVQRLLDQAVAALYRETARQKTALLAPFTPLELALSADEVFQDDRNAELTVSFLLPQDRRAVEQSFRMGQGGQAHRAWASPIQGSMSCQNGFWSLRFRVRELTQGCSCCFSDFWLGGQDSQGQPIVGCGLLQVRPAKDDETFQGLCSL